MWRQGLAWAWQYAFVYRGRAIAEMGRLRHWVGLIGAQCAVIAGLQVDAIPVQGCECKDLGEDGRLYTVLLHRGCFAAMAQACVGSGGGLSDRGATVCARL